jgi:hypothetical protein
LCLHNLRVAFHPKEKAAPVVLLRLSFSPQCPSYPPPFRCAISRRSSSRRRLVSANQRRSRSRMTECISWVMVAGAPRRVVPAPISPCQRSNSNSATLSRFRRGDGGKRMNRPSCFTVGLLPHRRCLFTRMAAVRTAASAAPHTRAA